MDRQKGIESGILVFASFPFLLVPLGLRANEPIFLWITVASLSSLAILFCAYTWNRDAFYGKPFALLGLVGCYFLAFPLVSRNPFAALLSLVLGISFGFILKDSKPGRHPKTKFSDLEAFQRAWWGNWTFVFFLLFYILLDAKSPEWGKPALLVSFLLAQLLFLNWVRLKRSYYLIVFPILELVSVSWLIFHTSPVSTLALFASFCALNGILLFNVRGFQLESKEFWWDVLLNHPARVLLSTFFLLCLLGTLCLVLPIATTKGTIEWVDAAFTSVSAVCVTGLIVLDTPHDFTLIGQAIILLFIQLGGLGIMSIGTVALHALGRRMSLKQEMVLTSIMDTDHQDLVQSLVTILKVTFLVESVGATFLFFLFTAGGDSWPTALWRAVFTAISAFCNAGFALQSSSLIPFQDQPLILHVIGLLIILGGLAPATSLLIPHWLSGRKIPVQARIPLVTSVVLLFAGTFFLIAFEWNGVLDGMSFWDKVHNAWFQSVTLRTAGFNSVEMNSIASPTFLLMLVFMFVGGSPGGTAGGIKTTTIGILALTFWANITNQNGVVFQHRRIGAGTIYRAITVVGSGLVIWVLVVLMLEVTQNIPARDLLFEATSAIGTVGLSTGATPYLDEIGKVIIVIGMFAGRVGPMTLFMLLSGEQTTSVSKYPETKISIT